MSSTAYLDGADAFSYGAEFEDNPYPEGSYKHNEWRMGWEQEAYLDFINFPSWDYGEEEEE